MHALTTDSRLGADRSESTRRAFPFFHLVKQSRGLQKMILGSCCFVFPACACVPVDDKCCLLSFFCSVSSVFENRSLLSHKLTD